MIPKSFIPKKNLKAYKNLLDTPIPKISKKNLDVLLKGCDKYLEELSVPHADMIVYDLNFTKHDLQPFCDEIFRYESDRNFRCVGIYISALVKRVLKKDEEIMLELPDTPVKLSHIGCELYQGTLIIKGNVGDFAGSHMRGGKLVILGDAEKFTGMFMMNGEILVEGKIGTHTASEMTGGKLSAKRIYGISDFYKMGVIYENGKQVRPLKFSL